MYTQLLHIFRNSPLGRETFLQSLYFCASVGATPVVYIPTHSKFLMYFDNDVVQVDLDNSYLTSPETAVTHAEDLIRKAGVKAQFLKPKHFTASTLPDVSTQFDYMCLPRSVSDMTSKIGLGYIGPRVRRIVNSARFPVLITSPVFKPWKTISVLFGGSANAQKALRLGLRISRDAGVPLKLFTQSENRSKDDYLTDIRATFPAEEAEIAQMNWHFFEDGRLEENLYAIPHDSLVVLGAFGHGLIRDLVFGSKMEKIQSTLPNSLLVVGPNYAAPA
ncbi:MAG: universal stress protein [Desulfobacterales bacterium]|jgi:hypothetical protein